MSISLRSGQHVDLPSQQRRLRHLRSISARKLTLADEEYTLLDAYFTLHVPGCKQEFYKSEVIRQSLNPNWAALDPHSMVNKTDTAIPAFQIKVWALMSKEFIVVIDWLVDLGALVYVGETVQYKSTADPPNSLIFGMFNGYYAAPPEHYSRLSREALEASLSLKTLTVARSSASRSYSKWTLISVVEACQELSRLRGNILSLKKRIGQRIDSSVVEGNRRQQCEAARVRIRLLRDDLDRQAIQERCESMALEKLKDTVREKASSLKQSQVELANLEARLTDERLKLTSRSNSLFKLNAQASYRRSDLLCQLTRVFPIEMNGERSCILGIKLPDAGSYSGSDDDQVAAALGYVCHLVFVISQILGVPLTHPVSPSSSTSCIRNEIRNDLTGSEREFQLFARTKNRERFSYGVFLLNQNIAQLRLTCGLQTTDLRVTLFNLQEFFQLFVGTYSNPSQSQERSTPFFSSQPVSHTAGPPPLYTPPDAQHPSNKQWLQPPNDAPPPPYEAVADTQERSPQYQATISSTAHRELSPICEHENREMSLEAADLTCHELQPNDHTAQEETSKRTTTKQGDSREERTGKEGQGKRTEDAVETRNNEIIQQIRNASSDSCAFDGLLAGRSSTGDNHETSRNSPGLMRATTRLAGIGFGAGAAAQALRPRNSQRRQRKIVRNRTDTDDQTEGWEVNMCGEMSSEERRDNGDGVVRERRADSDRSDIATTS